MSKVITVPATPEGLREAAEWLKDYARQVEENAKLLLEAMLEVGERWMITDIQHIDTGQTISTIAGYRNGNKGYLLVGGAAVWIEFGTGVVRNVGNDPHPKAAELGMSPWGTFGKGFGSRPQGWWYVGDDGEAHHTYGIMGNKFVYNTAQYLRKACPTMAEEIFR